jgi:hypothetical protein
MLKSRIQSTIAMVIVVALGISLLVPFPAGASPDIGNLKSGVADSSPRDLRDLIESYNTDRGSLSRTYSDVLSPLRRARFKKFFEQWRDSLLKLDFETLTEDGRIDYLLFKNHLDHELRQLDEQARQLAESEPLIPFAGTVFELDETRRRMEPVDAAKVAAQLSAISKQIESLRRTLSAGAGKNEETAAGETKSDGTTKTETSTPLKVKKNVANRAAATIVSLRNTLKNWFEYYNGYDPIFTWWVAEAYKAADQALQSYAVFMSEKVAGVRFAEATEGRTAIGAGPESQRGARSGDAIARSANARPGDASDIVGDPIGREALLVELASEMIPYT